jgi:hypothetical protein
MEQQGHNVLIAERGEDALDLVYGTAGHHASRN